MPFRVHLSPLNTIKSAKYKKWMSSFSPLTIHIGAGRGVCLPRSSFIAATRENNKQYLLCPDFFRSISLIDGSDNREYEESNFVQISLDIEDDQEIKEGKKVKKMTSIFYISLIL